MKTGRKSLSVDKNQNDRLDIVHFRHSIFNQPLFRSEKVRDVVNGTVKASILNASAQSGKHTQLNFELTPKTKFVKTHKVWIAADTGTHIGGGQWIDVDDNGNPVNNNGVSSVEKFRVIQ